MSVPVNLYVDRMSPQQPVRVADVYQVTQDRSSAYTEAAAKIGLTPREYVEFRQALTEGGAIYVRLPRHIDAMAGVHRRNGQVYALRNVLVPSGTMGWQVNLADGTTVLVPRICGNLSMNRARAVAARPHAIVAVRPHAIVVARTQPTAVRAERAVAAPPVEVAATPVTFDVPPAVAPAGAPVAAAAVAGGVAHAGLLPFLGLIFPVAASYVHGGPTTPPVSSIPDVPPCSGGSNSLGVCRR